jgi:ATP-dependent helicase/nuclease subunit B
MARRTTRLLVTPDAASRLLAARTWLGALPADAEALVLGPTWEAADDLVRDVVAARGARFGVVRLTLDRLAARLATRRLAEGGLTPTTPLTLVAVVARAVHLLLAEGRLAYFAPVARGPGFAAAVARTLGELRMNGIGPDRLAPLARGGADLAHVVAAAVRELEAARLADRAAIYEAALAVLDAGAAPLIGLPLLLLDVTVESAREATLLARLATRAPRMLATLPEGDHRSIGHLERALGVSARREPPRGTTSLALLTRHLFADTAPARTARDASVAVTAWPDEARECVEIARAVHAAARDEGIPFDRIAVALRSPAEYAAHLEEAFARADVPFFAASGARRPHPAGRALLALLDCAAEGLSARRFAEYLSLGQVPDPGAAPGGEAAFAAPASDLLPEVALAEPFTPPPEPVVHPDPEAVAVVEGTLHAPWRWEQLLVEASVIGKAERWRERLDGLAHELERRRREVADENGAQLARLERTSIDLGHLRGFALPLIDALAALPAEASWRKWLDVLRVLATRTLREPAEVLRTLGELAPMGPIGSVDLDEVRLVLAPRLRDLTIAPPRRRYGAVFVAPPEALRGLEFDVVFVPGLVENVFPAKRVEDPILLDEQRAAASGELLVEQDRIRAERCALAVAAGAAVRRVVFSYPRVDVERARPRVPSVYALEVVRATEGVLPSFDELSERARVDREARLGWPAPAAPEAAIDEAEYDLALIGPLLDADPETTIGTASYLLGANTHLARALRARARRWLKRWTAADGLVDPPSFVRDALATQQLDQRSFSPTALQHFAVCPYRFFLQAIHRLAPREDAVAIEVMDPLTRGALFHDVQFGVLTALRERGFLPLTAARVATAGAILDEVLGAEDERARARLCPAIPRVWEDGIAAIRADLREWLERMAAASDGWVPYRFELSFGLADRQRAHEDPGSVADPVPLDEGLVLRGSIDLVERRDDGRLRVTDHKTGKVAVEKGAITQGGRILQPVLYALACERLLNERVEAGRLYYCTNAGDFTDHVVPLVGESRECARQVVRVIGEALRAGFLPAAPDDDACRWCDYRVVCGPYEVQRVRRKPAERLASLASLRGLP